MRIARAVIIIIFMMGIIQMEGRCHHTPHVFDWDNPEYDAYLVAAIYSHGRGLLRIRPRDWRQYTKRYPNSQHERIRFWGNILVRISYYESKWDTYAKYPERFDSNGMAEYSRGLFQLSMESGKGYGCQFTNEDVDVHNPRMNIECAVKILDRWIRVDKRISGRNRGWKGGARYWAVMRPIRRYNKKALASIKKVNK